MQTHSLDKIEFVQSRKNDGLKNIRNKSIGITPVSWRKMLPAGIP